MTAPRAAAAATTAFLALVLGACSSTGDATTDAPTAKGSPSAVASTERVELPTGLSFAVPEDWDAISTDTVGDALSEGKPGEIVTELASRLGMTAAQFDEQLENFDVFLAAPHAEDGFLGNINALHVAGEMPSDGSLRLQHRALGAKDITVDSVDTAVGEASVVTYTLPVGAIEVAGQSIVLEHDGDTVVITISTGGADRSEKLADGVIDTLALSD